MRSRYRAHPFFVVVMMFSSVRIRALTSLIASALLTGFADQAHAAAITREANRTLHFPSKPPSGGYVTVDAFPGLQFNAPVCMATPPGETNRLFVLEKGGKILVITNLAKPTISVFLDLTPLSISSGGEAGLLGLAFHPGYATNGYLYAFYSLSSHVSSQGTGLHQRVARFEAVPPDANMATLGTERPLFTQIDRASNHNGGDLHFGPDGYLYVSLGDEGDGNDSFNNSQRIDKNFFSGMLRLDVDSLPENLVPNPHPALLDGNVLPYRIPADNPWVGATTLNGVVLNPIKVRSEFFAIGLRNPWRFSFDPVTGWLWCGDVGQDAREEIDVIQSGGNYGWAFREASIAGPKPEQVPAGTVSLPPVYDYRHGSSGTNTGNSVTGGRVYRGTRLPDLLGQYVFGDYVSGGIWAFRYDGSQVTGFRRLTENRNVSAFGRDPRNGDLLLADLGANKIKRLDSAVAGGEPALPSTLADTGVFSDLLSLQVQPGIVPYDVNTPFWSDGAEKRRWFVLTNTTLAFRFSANSNWSFPAGAVWIKHFELVTNQITGDKRRLETRFIVKNTAGVYGVTYRWDASGTNATLVPDQGIEEEIPIMTADGGSRTQRWTFPSRSACLACHSALSGGVLGFRTAQLNGDLTYPSGIRTNQLRALTEARYLRTLLPPLASLPRTVSVDASDASLEYRVRSYLEANCAGCHQPGGPTTGSWDARLITPTDSAKLIQGLLNDNGGDTQNRVVLPGDPDHSILLKRISVRGQGQMPPLASSELDVHAIELLRAWIQSDDLKARASFDTWHELYFASHPEADGSPTGDPDGDGSSNSAEFLAGTNPLESADLLNLHLIWREGRPLLQALRPANRRLEVEYRDSLAVGSVWKTLSLDLQSPAFSETSQLLEIPVPADAPKERYYRTRVSTP